MSYDRIPPELQDRPQWVLWRREVRDGKPTKVPYRVDDPARRASTADPATWGTFESAVAASARADGIGYVFSAEDPFCGVDLDRSISRENGFGEGVAEIVRTLASYTEASQSGTGLHIIVKAKLPGRGRKTEKTP